MAGILARISAFARSPQGQRAIAAASRKAQEVARDPATKAKVAELRGRLAARRGGSTGSGGSTDAGGSAGR